MLAQFVPVLIRRRVDRPMAYFRTFVAALGLLGVTSASAGSARDTIDLDNPRDGRLWVKEVPFTICEMNVKDPQGKLINGAELKSVQERRGCVDNSLNSPFLDDATAQKVRDAKVIWNNMFGSKIKFTELYVRNRESNIVQFVQAVREKNGRGVCGTEKVGFFRSVDIKHVFLDANCAIVGSPGAYKPGLGAYSIIHEMMHVIGVYHEQQRSDRGIYIDVKPLPAAPGQVCPKGYDSALKQFTVMGLKNPDYDFESLMHYKLRLNAAKTCAVYMALTPDGKELLAAKGLSQSIIGQRDTLSDGDIAAVWALYR